MNKLNTTSICRSLGVDVIWHLIIKLPYSVSHVTIISKYSGKYEIRNIYKSLDDALCDSGLSLELSSSFFKHVNTRRFK